MAPASMSDTAARWVLSRILEGLGNPPLELSLAGRVRVKPPHSARVGSIDFADWRTLFAVALEPEFRFGEGYSRGTITIGGNLPEILAATFQCMERVASRSLAGRVRSPILSLLQANSARGSRLNIHRHYDLGTGFYSLWLDEQMVYTGAYFAESHLSLEAAQMRKMDHVCRKVRLSAGDSVIEAGCGWGALALHMARRYGARVRAFNISRDQIQYARARANAEGLADRVEFIEDDYRNITGRADVFISIGMLEHVGPRRYRELAAVIDRCLSDDGRALLHFIGRNRRRPLNAWIRRRIFPGAYPPTLSELFRALEHSSFSVLDVENLRLHYALTLKHWLERYERSAARIREMFGPEFERAWRLYLAGSAASFHAGALQLFQVAFARAKCNRIAWTRAHLYEEQAEAEAEQKWTTATS